MILINKNIIINAQKLWSRSRQLTFLQVINQFLLTFFYCCFYFHFLHLLFHVSDHLLPLSSYNGHITYIYYELIPVALLIVNLNFPSLLFIDVVFTFPTDTGASFQWFICDCLVGNLMIFFSITVTTKDTVTNESINKME